MNERITAIEIHLMHHENSLQELSDVIARQQQEISQLQSDLHRLTDLLQRVAPAMVCTEEEEEPPPHY